MDTVRRIKLTNISTSSVSSLDPISAGISLGALFGALHLGWALLVAVGWAQPLMDFIFRLHFIRPVYAITPFDLGSAALLVLITALSGFAMGYVFAALWNRIVCPHV